MTTETRHRLPMPAWAGITLLFVVLAGLVGMHALDTHGLAAEHATAPGHVMSSGHVMSAGTATSSASALPTTSPWRAPGAHGSMVGLCVGLVAGTALLLLLGRDPVRVAGAERALLRAPVRLTRGRDPDPPSLIRLSVHRC